MLGAESTVETPMTRDPGRTIPAPGSWWLTEPPLGYDPASGSTSWFPPVEIVETDDEVVLRAELPGATRQDVRVEAWVGILSIRGVKRPPTAPAGRRLMMEEREYGRFERAFRLPEDADPGDCRAEMADGVLTVRVGRRTLPRRRIRIGGEEQ